MTYNPVPTVFTTVAAPSLLYLTFSENILKNTTGNIIIWDDSDSTSITMPITNSNITVANTILTITLPYTLISGKLYHVTIDNTAIVSYSYQYYAGISDTTWSFITSGKSLFLLFIDY